jgi:murein DD-endopeptidase MepM/ murein hydrolase activator NlpD
MKVMLTENQLLVLTKRIVESEVNIPNPDDLGSVGKFLQLYQDPEKALIDRLGPEKAMEFMAKLSELGFMDSSTTKDKNSAGGGNQQFATNIPNGNDLMNPLGHRTGISSKFGLRNITRGSKNHKGVDLPTPSGSEVYAPGNATVLYAGDTTPNGCGGYVQLDHGTMITKFCHLRDWVVNKGQTVKKGQLIGHSGGGSNDPHRGTSTGAHLHYEILNSSGVAVNPTSVQNNLG